VSVLLDIGGHGLGHRYDALDAGWRGAMLRAIGLGGADVQWVPGALDAALSETAAGLSCLADRVPPATATAPLAVAGRIAPRWSTAYRQLLSALLPEIGVGLRGYLGAAYPGWVRYRNAANPDLTQKVLFRRWVQGALRADMRREVCRLFDAAARDPVSRARDAFGAATFHDVSVGRNGRLVPVPGYATAPSNLAAAFFAVQGGNIRFDSDQLQPADRGDLAHGGARLPALLPGLRSDPFDPLERRLAAARITVRGQVGSRAVVPVAPRGWYDAQIVQRALSAGPCSNVWDNSTGHCGWAAFFGPRGAMLRHAAQLLLVADLRVELTYAGVFDETEQARILACLGLRPGVRGHLRVRGSAGGGIWPFVIHRGQSALQATARFDAQGSLVLDLRLPAGRPMFWGVRIGRLSCVA
jgi:hypothetical protein